MSCVWQADADSFSDSSLLRPRKIAKADIAARMQEAYDEEIVRTNVAALT